MTGKVAATPAFANLLGELQTMAKAIDVNQERIEAGRKAEGHMQSGEELAKSEEAKKKEEEDRKKKEEEDRKKKENEGGGKGEKGEMRKSFSMQTADGKTVEVEDATDLLKALDGRLEEVTTSVYSTLESATTLLKGQGALITSMGEKLVAQSTTIQAQETLIKSLREDVDKLNTAPGGRKTVVALTERQPTPATSIMAKSGIPEGVTPDTFFAKAHDLQLAGKLTGLDISIAEASLNSGLPIPAAIVQRVLS